MSTALSNTELLASLDRHFAAGCPSLSTGQLKAHQASGTCRECRERARQTVPAEAAHAP